jgi:hypothetical protein
MHINPSPSYHTPNGKFYGKYIDYDKLSKLWLRAVYSILIFSLLNC